jgi:hypothetical protein
VRLALLATAAALVATTLVPVQAEAIGPVTASSSAGATSGPDKAFDGSFGTAWRAAAAGVQWLQVDLGAPHALTSIRQTFANRDTWRFRVSGSLDGATWVRLMDRERGIAGQSFATSASGVHRYVRLTVTGAARGSIPSSTEFLVQGSATEVEITPPDATVHTSSQLPAYEGRHVVDGDSSTYWVAGNHTLPQWVTVDLGAVTPLSSVEQNFKDYDLVRFQIAGSNDNVNFTTLVDRGPVRGQYFHERVQGSYRYVRVTITQTEFGHWAGSTGVKVFTPLVGNGPVRDLAYNTTATSSSLANNYEPRRAVDGRPGSAWISCWIPAPDNCVRPPGITGDWLKVDLGHVSSVTRIEQRFLDDDQWWFTVEGSVDGVTWQQLMSRQGVAGRSFSATVSGLYRYIRLTVPRASGRGHWPASEHLKVFGNGSPVPHMRWVERSGPLQRFYPKHYFQTLNSITDQLDDLREQGYAGIELAAPYKGPRTPWAGLGATDNYAIDPSIGTMADFERLIGTAHQLGMRVVMFGNAGYSSPAAPFWDRAQRDAASVERRWFAIVPASGPGACDNGARWYWSELARGCYFSFWTDPFNAANHMPSYNFANQEWRDETARYLRFWMDKGLDGFGMDAPRAYLNINSSPNISQRYITAVLDNYDSWTLPEGLQPHWDTNGPGDLVNGVPELHYNTIHDLSVNRWGCSTDCSRIVAATRSGNPSALEDYFKNSRDTINHQGGVTILAPSWDSDVHGDGSIEPSRLEPASVRLLEMATVLTSGNQFIMHYGNHLYLPHERTIPSWTAAQQELVNQLLRAQGGSSALDPRGLRYRLPTNDNGRYYAFLRTDKTSGTRALVVLNFQNSQQTVDVALGNTGIAPDQTPIDLLTGQASGTAIAGGNYRVTLPARGFAVLSVR